MAAFYSGHSPSGNLTQRTWNAEATYVPRLDAPSREPLPGKQEAEGHRAGLGGPRCSPPTGAIQSMIPSDLDGVLPPDSLFTLAFAYCTDKPIAFECLMGSE